MPLLDKLLNLVVTQVYAQDKDIFGSVSAPEGVAQYNLTAGGSDAIGITVFASRALQVFTVIAGIFALYNFVMAGFFLVSGGGKSEKYSEATNKITMSVIGLIIIVASYTIAGLVGLLIFGDAGYILNPQICGPGGC